jgi:hypothetical protein
MRESVRQLEDTGISKPCDRLLSDALGSLLWWRREESEYSALLKTCNLLIFRGAQNARNGKIALNWNVSGTRDFFTSVPK